MNKLLLTLILSASFVAPVVANDTCCSTQQTPAVETQAMVEVAPAAEQPMVEESATAPVTEPVAQAKSETEPEMSEEEIELMIKKLIEQQVQEQQAQDAAEEQQAPAAAA